MRRKEITDGIKVSDEFGKEVVGVTSKKAGLIGVTQTAICRVVSSFPVMFLPGLIMSQFEKTKLLKTYPKLSMPLNLATISACLLAALPPSIALFPQIAKVNVNQLESELTGLKDSRGAPLETIYFNRGL